MPRLTPVRRWPTLLTGLGVLLGLVTALEWVAVVAFSADAAQGYVVGILTSLPFIAGLAYAGVWLQQSGLPEDQYSRIGTRTLVGLALFLGTNVALVVALPPASHVGLVSWLRWAAALGAGVGLLVGLFEAQAVTNERRAERAQYRQRELQRQNERLDEFASIVSHDLRNPLNVAQGRLELAREDCESEHIDGMAGALDRMEDLVDDLLTLAREGRVVDDPETASLAAVVEQAWSSVETGEASLATGPDLQFRADRSRLQQLLENLFRNSVEHGATAGDPAVTVTAGPLEDDDGFYVADDGAGIPADEREDVFDTAYTTSPDGTGFGLAIVEQTATAHGWTVVVTDSEDGGARFEFRDVDVV